MSGTFYDDRTDKVRSASRRWNRRKDRLRGSSARGEKKLETGIKSPPILDGW